MKRVPQAIYINKTSKTSKTSKTLKIFKEYWDYSKLLYIYDLCRCQKIDSLIKNKFTYRYNILKYSIVDYFFKLKIIDDFILFGKMIDDVLDSKFTKEKIDRSKLLYLIYTDIDIIFG